MFGWDKLGVYVAHDKNLALLYHGFKAVKMAILCGCIYFGYTRYEKKKKYREMTKKVETDGNYKPNYNKQALLKSVQSPGRFFKKICKKKTMKNSTNSKLFLARFLTATQS